MSHLAAIDPYPACVSVIESSDEPQRRRVAAARRAEKYVERSWIEGEGNAVNGANLPARGGPVLADVLDSDRRHQDAFDCSSFVVGLPNHDRMLNPRMKRLSAARRLSRYAVIRGERGVRFGDLARRDALTTLIPRPALNDNKAAACQRSIRKIRLKRLARKSGEHSCEKRRQSGARVRGAHECLADEKCVYATSAHALDVCRREDSAFRDRQPVGRNARQEVESRLERDVERAQAAVVDSDQGCGKLERAVQLRGVVHFDQNAHAELMCAGLERGQPRILESGNDQENAIGTERSRLQHLVLVDHKILAQRRQAASLARCVQMLRTSLEIIAIGQYRAPRRSSGLVTPGEGGGIENRPQHALARARLLDLRDHGGAPCSALGAKRAGKIARRGRWRGAFAHLAQRNRCLRGGKLFGLGGENAGEDVARGHRGMLRYGRRTDAAGRDSSP